MLEEKNYDIIEREDGSEREQMRERT